MSSEYKVAITTIRGISPHPNADRLEIAQVYGFNVVVGKNSYVVGEKCILVPIDSILPKNLEDKLFPEGSKIVLHKSRVKQIKIRNYPSQGMIISTGDVEDLYNINLQYTENDVDISELLGIKKYEPPTPNYQIAGSGTPRAAKQDHPLFHEYGGISNVKYFPDLFANDELVVIQEKLHGTCARLSILPTQVNTTWKRILKFLGLLPVNERHYGSNRVQISTKSDYKGYYGKDVYGSVFNQVKAFEKVKPGEIIYGEIIGQGIQGNYTYGVKDQHFVLFDVKVLQPDNTLTWLSPKDAQAYAKERGFDFVPVLYEGPYSKEEAYKLTSGPSVYAPTQKVREGIAIKSMNEYNDVTMPSHKRCLKWLGEDYLAQKDVTDFH